MGLVSFVVAVVAGAALAGGAGVVLVNQVHPDKVIVEQDKARQQQGLPPLAEPEILEYGTR